jgi:uncharacterized membrane protein YkvA (DUF1232 family)
MRDFADILAEEVGHYNGRHQNYILEAPAFYRLMTNLLDDPALPERLRPAVLVAVAYFVIPEDIISEELQGPSGFLDDLYVCAIVADHIRRELKSDEMLERNWEGQGLLQSLLKQILANEIDLIGDKRDQILQYIGWNQIKKI